MLRQSSIRIQKNRGFKVKHALQITLLIGVCVWLLYQVKHSHDKRNALIASEGRVFIRTEETVHGVFRFGRKDTRSQIQMVTDKLKEEDAEEEEEEEVKHDENEEEKRESSEDIVEERDRDTPDDDVEQEEEFMDGGEEESENSGGKTSEADGKSSSENQESGNGDSQDAESISNGLIHDTQLIRSDVTDSEQGMENEEHVEVSNLPETAKEEDGDTILSQTTDGAIVEETELKSNSSEANRVYGEGEAVDDSLHNGTRTTIEEFGGVKLSEVQDESQLNSTVSDRKIPTQSQDLNTTSSESLDETTTLFESQEQNTTTSVELQQQNTTLSESQDQVSILSESQDQNTTLSEVQDENTSLSESEDQNISLQESQDQNITLSESQDNNITLADSQYKNARLSKLMDGSTDGAVSRGENTTLSNFHDQNTTVSDEQIENTDSDPENREHSEAEVVNEAEHRGDDDNSSNSILIPEERDALTDLGTLPQHDGEDTESKAVGAE